jgi:dUTP pyrophosphatase
MEKIEIRIKTGDSAQLPQYQTLYSAGMDLHASLDSAMRIEPGARVLVPTGLYMEIPPGFEGQVRPRSGLALKYGITVLNSPGTIDSDYRGEVKVLLINHGSEAFDINPGERIAQLIVAPFARVQWIPVQELDETERGAGGYGSTGV